MSADIQKMELEMLHRRYPKSNMFDLTLLITLLTNLTNLESYFDKLPLVTDTTPSADLARIKYYRNLISHSKDGKIDNLSFSTAMDDIIEAVGRLGGQNMFDESKKFRTKMLHHSTVPWNIRVQIKDILDTWKSENSSFVETRAAKQVFECVQANSCVTITASSGVGKTATLRHVSLQMADEGYDILPVTSPQDIVNFYNPNEKILFVIDDWCGTYSLNQCELNSWEPVIERVKVLVKNKLTKIIVACRLQVYQDQKLETISIFRTCVYNLLSEDLCLTKIEKISIAELYLKTKAAEIVQYCDLYDCFPLLCKLYHDNPDLDKNDFFKNPFLVYKVEIDKLHNNGHFGKYCALALCVFFNNGIKEEWLTDEIEAEKRKKIENICEECKLDRGTSRLILLDELKSLINTFITKDRNVYKTIHDKIFDFIAFYFGQTMIQSLIRNASSLVISQRFLLERTDDMDTFITIVPPTYHQIYMQRMIDDWSIGKLQCVFTNINLKIPEFRQRFLCYLNTFDVPLQRQLALTCDVDFKFTVLALCCQYDDISLIQWCIDHGVDVNQCNKSDVSPLYISAFSGHADIVKILLDNKADINKCRDNGASPLHCACHQNHIEIVKVLLDNNADINTCTDAGDSPLLFACQNNHIEVVKVLLDNKAAINMCKNNGMSPLYIACQSNHIETVMILLNNKADINKCMNDGISPLYIACLMNHIEIIKVLLENKAEIDKSADDGYTPLQFTCHNNHIDTVKVFLEYNADINRCTDDGASPLFFACQNNQIEVVKVLLDNKADINKCTNDGQSPLFRACANNHIGTVKTLLDNNADINKSTNDDGTSPLHVACGNNHIETVRILLDNNADINKCTKGGESPLFLACLFNYVEIVKELLNNNADINKCTDKRESPFLIAHINNHTAIVELLLKKGGCKCIIM